MLRVFLDDTLLNDQPEGLDELEFTINLDFENRTILKDSKNDLTFYGQGYLILYKSFLANGYEGQHTVKIEKRSGENWFKIWEGYLFISDVTLDLGKHKASVKIQDLAYYSLIKNNQKVEMYFAYNKTKNNLYNDNTANEVLITMFAPPATATTGSRNVFNLIDIFKSLTSFISDNRVAFASNYLTDLEADGIAYGLVNGFGLRQLAENAGSVIFEDLIIDIGRAHNLYLSVDDSSGSPVLRLESLSYYNNSEVVVNCNDVRDIKRSYYQELLYSSLKVGSAESPPVASTVSSFPYHPPFSFNEESYFLEGRSNINSSKDLRFNTFIVDTNIIEDVYVNGNDEYDDKLFLIQYNPSILAAERCLILGGSLNHYYNGSLTNNEIIRRHPWQGGQKALFGDASEELDALSTDTVLTMNDKDEYLFETPPLKFSDDFYDPGTHYDPGTGRYVASADGTKNVTVRLGWNLQNPLDLFGGLVQGIDSGHIVDLGYLWLRATLKVSVYDSFGTLKDEYYNQPTFRNYIDCIDYGHPEDIVFEEGFFTTYLNNTDYFEVTAIFERRVVAFPFIAGADPNGMPAYDSSLQATNPFTDNTGNILVKNNNSLRVLVGTNLGGQVLGELNNSFFVNRWEFQNDLTDKEIIDLLNAPYKAIRLTNIKENINLNTWVKSVSIKPLTNNTDFETINALENI